MVAGSGCKDTPRVMYSTEFLITLNALQIIYTLEASLQCTILQQLSAGVRRVGSGVADTSLLTERSVCNRRVSPRSMIERGVVDNDVGSQRNINRPSKNEARLSPRTWMHLRASRETSDSVGNGRGTNEKVRIVTVGRL